MRIAVGDDAHHLGVAGRFISQIFDALAGAYGLGDAGGSRVDAVRRRFFLNTVVGLIEKIGIDLFFDRAVDGKIVQFMFAVVDVHLAQGGLRCVCGKGGGRKQAKKGQQSQKKR